MRRLLALIGALAMVGGALLIRGVIDDDDTGPKGGDTPVLLCASELAAVCAELEDSAGIRTATAPINEVAGDPDLADYDGWLTFESNTKNSAVAPLLEDSSAVIARSPLVLAIETSRGDVLAAHCGGEVTWRCIGDVAGTRWESIGGEVAWGTIKLGHADPASTGEGLAVIGQAAQQFFGPNKDLSRDDFDTDAFLAWFTQLERAAEIDADAFEQLLTSGAALFAIVATTEAKAGPQLAGAARDRQARVRLLYPDPVATADIVFAPFVGGDSDLADIVTGGDGKAALVRAGYRVSGEDGIDGVPSDPPLPSRSNLPDGDVLEALLQTWREVTG